MQELLEHLGLLLTNNPAATTIVAAKDEIGKMVSQNPGAGFKLSPGKAVAVVVGVAAKQVPVPSVCGKSLGDAQTALKQGGLTVGPVQPSAADPKAMTLANGCEVPAANQSVAQGSPVSLFLQSAGANALPSVQNLTAAAAASKLQAAGLKTITIPVLATHGAGGERGHAEAGRAAPPSPRARPSTSTPRRCRGWRTTAAAASTCPRSGPAARAARRCG